MLIKYKLRQTNPSVGTDLPNNYFLFTFNLTYKWRSSGFQSCCCFPPPVSAFSVDFQGYGDLLRKDQTSYIYVLMHETDIFTSQGHWELISRWLESGGKWKPLSKHSILFLLWIRSWKWSGSEAVSRDVSVPLMVWAQLGRSFGSGRLRGHAPCSPSEPICAIACLECLGVNVFSEVGLRLEPPAARQVSPGELAGGVASPGCVRGVAGFGWARGQPRGPKVLGSRPHREEGKSRAYMS